MAFVDEIANRLTDQVSRNRITGKVVFFQQLPAPFHITRLGQRGLDIEMIAPTAEFHAVVAHLFHAWEKFRKRDISPLPGK